MTADGYKVSFGMMKKFWNWRTVIGAHHVNALNSIELYASGGKILCYVLCYILYFTTIKKSVRTYQIFMTLDLINTRTLQLTHLFRTT